MVFYGQGRLQKLVHCKAMKDLANCRFCGDQPGIEGPLEDFWSGRGGVVRIECGCNMEYEYEFKHDGPWVPFLKEDGTEGWDEFGHFDECADAWNELQKVGGEMDSELMEILEEMRELAGK